MFIAGFAKFRDYVRHVPRRHELTALDVDWLACRGNALNEASLSRQERGRLQDVDHARDLVHGSIFVNVGNDGDANFLLH